MVFHAGIEDVWCHREHDLYPWVALHEIGDVEEAMARRHRVDHDQDCPAPPT
jgi:hypothetical protein